MAASSNDKKTVSKLNKLRQQAVELRLAGKSLAETQSAVGLSAPTIIAACKAFRRGGWEAVGVGPRGRPSRGSQRSLHTYHAELVSSMCANNDVWSIDRTMQWLEQKNLSVSRSTVANLLEQWNISPPSRYREMRQNSKAQQANTDDTSQALWKHRHDAFLRAAKRKRAQVLWVASRQVEPGLQQIFAHDLRGKAFWSLIRGAINATHYLYLFQALHRHFDKSIALVLPSPQLVRNNAIHDWVQSTDTALLFLGAPIDNSSMNFTPAESIMPTTEQTQASTAVAKSHLPDVPRLTHLQRLESESIHIMREVVAEAENPVMMYSVGKDSAVMLHLARKAFFPAPPPFPLLHVDTTWKFRAMYELRDSIPEKYGVELITHTNPEGLAQKVNPFTHGSSLHTDIMKTQALKQALDKHRFDFAFGGARRDEEKSRAKERVFSFRTAQHRWDAKNQRPELWHLYNTRKQRGESIRVFPLSNWTELDIWQYIRKEDIPIVPLYLAAQRPVVERDGSLIMVDDDRMPLQANEVPQMRSIRFRTLGCYPLTGAVESTATTLEEVIQEMLLTKTSERQGRMIDHDTAASMEKKKQEGYF